MGPAANVEAALTPAGMSLRESAKREVYRQIAYIVLGCLLAWGATWAVNELYHFGGAFGRNDKINPLFVQEFEPIPPDAVKSVYWESRDFGQAATLVVRNNEISLEDIVGTPPGKTKQELLQPLPAAEGQVFVERLSARGFITVIQHPTKENGYTAKIRIEDPYGEHSEYKMALYFQTGASGR
jgi:hypothetical protein